MPSLSAFQPLHAPSLQALIDALVAMSDPFCGEIHLDLLFPKNRKQEMPSGSEPVGAAARFSLADQYTPVAG
jgi:hypothetical protein